MEGSTFNALESAWKKAKKQFEREHVFPYIQSHPEIFKISNVKSRKELSYIRITVDKNNDLKFVREIYKRIPRGKNAFKIYDLEKILSKEPHLLKINKNIKFDDGYGKSLLMKRR